MNRATSRSSNQYNREERFLNHLEEYSDISPELKEELLTDFRKFEEMYNEKQLKRKNFLNMRYVLTGLLERREIPCKLYTMSNKKLELFYDKICEEIFEKMKIA
jgi:hypothetical protein